MAVSAYKCGKRRPLNTAHIQRLEDLREDFGSFELLAEALDCSATMFYNHIARRRGNTTEVTYRAVARLHAARFPRTPTPVAPTPELAKPAPPAAPTMFATLTALRAEVARVAEMQAKLLRAWGVE